MENKDNHNISTNFQWMHGSKAHTKGIWMWSKIFTHPTENVAIILLDTQGIFDHETDFGQVSTIFALNMMISSATCFNILRDIGENDLMNLKGFTEFAEYVAQQAGDVPFQKLLFIIRDWSFKDFAHGYDGGKAHIKDILQQKDVQTEDMQNLREDINRSFREIEGFLMPKPGDIVENGDFTGKVSEISAAFRANVKKLADAIFEPLIVKKVNGRNLKVKDWLGWLQVYMDTFHKNSLGKHSRVFEVYLDKID